MAQPKVSTQPRELTQIRIAIMSEDTNKSNLVEFEQPSTVSEAAPSVHNIPFIQISRELIQKSKLPIDARMLLIYLISFKEGWKFHDSVIRSDLGIGFTKLKLLFKQLRDAGYVKTVPIIGDYGRMTGSKRLFSSLPEFDKKPKEAVNDPESMESRQSVAPTVRKSEAKYNNNKYINNINKKINKKSFEKEFDEFWEINPKQVDKIDARVEFDKLLNDDYENFNRIMSGRLAENVVIKWENTDIKYVKGPASWLRKRRFNDIVKTEEQLREEFERSNKKSTNRASGRSRLDQQLDTLAEFKQAALRKQQQIEDELSRLGSEEGGSE
jgi:hypothetical protein